MQAANRKNFRRYVFCSRSYVKFRVDVHRPPCVRSCDLSQLNSEKTHEFPSNPCCLAKRQLTVRHSYETREIGVFAGARACIVGATRRAARTIVRAYFPSSWASGTSRRQPELSGRMDVDSAGLSRPQLAGRVACYRTLKNGACAVIAAAGRVITTGVPTIIAAAVVVSFTCSMPTPISPPTCQAVQLFVPLVLGKT